MRKKAEEIHTIQFGIQENFREIGEIIQFLHFREMTQRLIIVERETREEEEQIRRTQVKFNEEQQHS